MDLSSCCFCTFLLYYFFGLFVITSFCSLCLLHIKGEDRTTRKVTYPIYFCYLQLLTAYSVAAPTAQRSPCWQSQLRELAIRYLKIKHFQSITPYDGASNALSKKISLGQPVNPWMICRASMQRSSLCPFSFRIWLFNKISPLKHENTLLRGI
ncbi:hypothetical protein BT63DRAFT_134352 [Microthyrium microscopicum]|uniref:Uncharacterized protein n=1 Tax=Microthyrium microscopicum TaxID=703497 RepID=A0A6A6UKE8_9PEZI|nr:hypothetical protein BT63DRAFT_134352 [Microthyrium microscopicum]